MDERTKGWLKGMADVRGWINGWLDNQRTGSDRHLWDTERILQNLLDSIDRDVERARIGNEVNDGE